MTQVPDIFKQLLNGETLPESLAEVLFMALLAGDLDEGNMAAMLAIVARRGPTVDELVGAAKAMRHCATPVSIPGNTIPILDTCGTGGAPKLFNVSTLGAIVTAAAAPRRVLVAKHGNRSRTGRGSAELLEALGVRIHTSPEMQTACLSEVGFCFSFAPDHHPAARHASSVRQSLGFPTIFNLLGPLVNPAGATRQLVGTYSPDNALKLAEALARLGTDRAMVVTSHDGLDELTTTAPNIVHVVERGRIATSELDARSLGLPNATIAELRAQTLDEAVAIARGVLANTPGPTLDMVLLNAGASLHVAGVTPDIATGLAAAREAVSSGAAARTLDRLVQITGR